MFVSFCESKSPSGARKFGERATSLYTLIISFCSVIMMGSAYYRMREGREGAFRQFINEDYKYLVALVGVDNGTGKPARGAFDLFKELDEKAIRAYALTTAKENDVKLVKIEVWSLEAKLLQELHP